jgi:20S proteasome subunit beta 5
MNVLRDYIALELETSNVVSTSPFDLERTIDDFVFLTFFVGNDFLPHMPALDIGDEALDLLLFRYRSLRQNWFEEYQKDPESTPEPYLTHAGEIVSGKRLEHFLQSVGKHESNYYAYKEKTTDYDQLRKTEAKFGEVVTPSDDVLEAKEDADRHNYRQLVHQALQQGNGAVPSSMSSAKSSFIPVMASQLQIRENSDDIEEGEALEKQMGDLLQYSLGDKSKTGSDDGKPLVLDETDFKGRYYADKFGFSPYDADSHLALRKAYIEGLVWNLRYYYQSHHTNLNWEWFYPYHYGPMISDLVHLDSILAEVSSSKREMGAPLKPFEQLLACLPASQSKLLPLPYQELMTEPNSPIRDFYPESFTVDMNGKRWPWEAVVLLPFIDSGLLRESAARIDATHLTSEELARNKFSDAQVISREPGDGKSVSVPLQESSWRYIEGPVEPSFRPVVDERTVVPLDGLPTLRDGSIQCMERKKLRLNVHGNRSRYRTAVLEIASEIPELVPLEALSSLVGGTVYINYPSLIESFVTAVSNSRMLCRGQDPPKPWSSREAMLRRDRVGRIVGAYSKGLGMTGTGGLALPGNEAQFDRETLLNVRPLKGLKTLSDGTVVKTFAKYELEVPLFALSWAPVNEDTRLKGIPLQLELDPYHCAKRVLTDVSMSPRRSDPPGHQFSARGDGNTFDVAARRTSYMNSRSFSTLPLTTERLLGRPFYKAATIAVAEPGLAAPARVVRRFPNHRGRFIAAGLLWVAAFSGIKLAQASSSFSTNPQSAHAFVASTAKMNTGIVGTTATQEDSLYHPLADRRAPPLDFLHGTTTVSFKYQGGIVAAVDSRASLGNYIGSKTTQKVLPIHPSALGTMAGGAADCTFWIRRLAAEAALYAVENDGRRMSIARASRLLANSLYQNRGAGLSIGTMIMGYDSDPGSPARIYYVDNSGMRIEGDMFAVGSGSTYAQGILDTEHRFDMTDEEAISLGLKAIRHATFRDAGSGGFINVYLVKQDAWRHVFRQDIAATAAHLTDKPKQEDRTAS